MSEKVSVLIQDLSTIPEIIGGLGLSIAEAQKAFDLNYVQSLEKLVALAQSMLAKRAGEEATAAGSDKIDDFIFDLLKAVAPSRYQFSETTLSVKLDLGQTLSEASQKGFGVNMGAVAVSAAMTTAFGYDYRAAAEVKTVLHAISVNDVAFRTLLNRVKETSSENLSLPEDTPTVDQNIITTSQSVFDKVMDKPAAPIANINKTTNP